MNLLLSSNWITPQENYESICPIFKKDFQLTKTVGKAELYITALGVYEAVLNGQRVGEFLLAPGWTAYNKRLQYQVYDVTPMLTEQNQLEVTVGRGWCLGGFGWVYPPIFWSDRVSLIATIRIQYTDGTTEDIITDTSWQSAKSPIRYVEIYHGETYDATITPDDWKDCIIFDHTKDTLIPQEGEIVKEIEEIRPKRLFTAPNGERIIDFGQNLVGYIRFTVKGNKGDIVQLTHAEVLDKDGNFYMGNLRGAKQKIVYTCSGSLDTYKPHFTFQGFRFVRIDSWPNEEINLEDITAVVIHSDMKRTGYFECSDPLVNQLYSNVIWGQKGNFVDVPTDCPQRDERLGWTGDAQVFIKTASYNYDVNKFFSKWLHDLAAEQFEDGGVPHVIPRALDGENSAAWGDSAVVCPWQLYLSYGNIEILKEQYESMRKWVEYVRHTGENEYLWNTGYHFGDWLTLDFPYDNDEVVYKNLIATAYYANTTKLFVKAGKVLGKDMSEYEVLQQNIVQAFKHEFIKDGKLIYNTQTAHVLALQFDLCDNRKEIAANLAAIIRENSNKLTTGFVGTPHLLQALSDNGYAELAYTLLLQKDYPSWLYPISKGATTMWERWDGITPDGEMTNDMMNSFNHYAYGAVASWMYGVMAGINIDENAPAYKHVLFQPITDNRFDYVRASVESKYGRVSAEWVRNDTDITYKFDVPHSCSASIMIDRRTYEVGEGTHEYVIKKGKEVIKI